MTNLLALPAGYRLDIYVIERVLGQGGFGITYLAEEVVLGKKVAIKELLPSGMVSRGADSTVVAHSTGAESDWEWAKERFLDEARALAKFRNAAIVDVHRYFEANGTAYIVMEYVEGETYGQLLQSKGREEGEAGLMRVMGPLLDGVALLHAENLLHRDIKPENILIRRDGRPVLIDFGAARYSVAGRSQSITAIVSHGYSPLEQYSEGSASIRRGPWTDIYSLGAVMWRAITGSKPESAPVRLDGEEETPLAARGIPGYRKEFLEAVDWAMSLKAKHRPQSLAEWREALESPKGRQVRGVSTADSAEKEKSIKDTSVRGSRKVLAFVILGALLLTGVVSGVWYWGYLPPPPPPPPPPEKILPSPSPPPLTPAVSSPTPREAEEEKAKGAFAEAASANSPPQSLYDFLDSWFASTSSNDANLVIGHYADQVAYCYSKGITSRSKLVQGQLQFTSKFPNRRYTDWNVGRIQPDGSGGYDIDYSFRYSYTGTKNANGRANVSISVRQFGGEWKITRFDETTSKL